uniref:DUF1985 domain-containing protein n=1 Tax=Brassica oleracea var. oleracea TaxID=109376 RepID=A0A0D2ZR25_BRAOL
MSSSLHDSPLHDSPLRYSPLRDSPLHDSHLHDSLQEVLSCTAVSNEFCTTLRLSGRVYEAGEPPDNPKAIIHHSKIDYVEKVEDILGKEEFSLIENSHIGSILKVVKRSRVQFSEELFHFLMQRRVLTQGEDLWFTYSDRPMRFSREFHLTTGLRCEEDQTITEPQFKIMKKPYLWMLGKEDKFTVRTLYEMFKQKARSMPTLERVSLGTAIITEAVIMAEKPSSKIPRDRLQRYMNYRLPKMAWGKTAYSILMRSVKSLSASSWTGDSYEVEVSTVIGMAEEYKHLVGATNSDDADFHSVVKLVQQGYKMRRSDWEKGFVDMFFATEDIGQQRKTKDEDAEHGEDLNHSEDEEENKDEEEKTDEEENKNEEYQKDKEQRKDKDHSMSNSEKLDKLIQMVRDLDKRVVVIQNVLGVKVSSPTPTFTSPKFDLLSQESHSGKGTNEVNEDVDPPLQKKFKADTDNVPLRRSERALVVGVKFLKEIDELYDEFLDDKKSFQFGTGFDKYNIEKNINFLYSAIAVAEKYWLGVVVNLEKRSITAFNCAAMKFTDASLVPYVNAYAMALPFMIRNFFKDVSMDTSS